MLENMDNQEVSHLEKEILTQSFHLDSFEKSEPIRTNFDPQLFKDLSIIFVDDEYENLQSFEMNIGEDFNTIVVESGEEALEIIRLRKDIAILIADQIMPGIKGLDLIEKAIKINPSLVSMIITGNATKELAIEGINRNLLWSFLEKPINFGDIDFKILLRNGIQQHLYKKLQLEYTEGTIYLLVKIIDARDGCTHNHSRRVRELSLKVGERLKLSEKEKLLLGQAALLHDVGKIGVADHILNKEGPLNATERAMIEIHSAQGAKLISEIKELHDIVSIIESHHERPDGKGYPRGICEAEIPLASSIIHVCDVFDALTSSRPYKKEPFSIEKAVNIIKAGIGTEFNPQATYELINIIAENKEL